MNGKRKKTLHVLRPRHNRSVAEKVEAHLPLVRWTTALSDEVAKLLANALVRDLRDHPPRETKCAS